MIGPNVIHCYTIDDFQIALHEYDTFSSVFLDYDLNDFDTISTYNGTKATGLDACGLLVKYRTKLPHLIVVHSANSIGSQKMVDFLQSHGFNAVRQMFPVV
jgi:hypothetical protein